MFRMAEERKKERKYPSRPAAGRDALLVFFSWSLLVVVNEQRREGHRQLRVPVQRYCDGGHALGDFIYFGLFSLFSFYFLIFFFFFLNFFLFSCLDRSRTYIHKHTQVLVNTTNKKRKKRKGFFSVKLVMVLSLVCAVGKRNT